MATAEEMLQNGQELSAYRQALKIIMDVRDEMDMYGNVDYFGHVILESVEEYLIDKVAEARHVWRQGRTKAEYPACSVEEWEEHEENVARHRKEMQERMDNFMNDVKGGKYGNTERA